MSGDEFCASSIELQCATFVHTWPCSVRIRIPVVDSAFFCHLTSKLVLASASRALCVIPNSKLYRAGCYSALNLEQNVYYSAQSLNVPFCRSGHCFSLHHIVTSRSSNGILLRWLTWTSFFYVDRASLYNLLQMKPSRCTLLRSIFISTYLHVSGNYVPIIRRTYCIYATLVFFTLYGRLSGWNEYAKK